MLRIDTAGGKGSKSNKEGWNGKDICSNKLNLASKRMRASGGTKIGVCGYWQVRLTRTIRAREGAHEFNPIQCESETGEHG